MRLLLSALLLTCFLVPMATPAGAGAIVLRPDATWTERAAAGDLQRVIYAATGKLLSIGPAQPSDRAVIAVGFSPVGGVDLSAKRLGEQGFVLKTVSSRGRTTLIAAGANPVSTSYAVYTLAERYGAGFYLGGDALPSKRTLFSTPKMDIVQTPVLKVRGVLPWYNFFNSPTAWNIEDHRSFIDQLAKSKNNFLGFHSYDYEPFCAYRDPDGKMVGGAPLFSTETPTWGTSSMKTSEFVPVARPYFEKPYFGADCSMGYKTPEQGIESAQKLLAEALWYAKARGVRTCVGFEVTGDPTAPGALDRLERRLIAVLKTYPMLDYVWIWEPEALGLWGTDKPAIRSDFGAYCRKWEDVFGDIDDPKRRAEAVRVGIYALAAHRILKREAPRVKMILSAWGGDNHLHFTDFYPGYDKILPKDIIFSALDNIITSDTVSAAYGKLPKDREFWPIPWFEYDGDQWCPQPNTRRFYNATCDALSKGASGMLGIHWRTRDVEESHAYMSQFAWNEKLSYEGFYEDYARKAYGDKRAAGLLMGLQDMGYRWVGGSGQSECGGFAWSVARDDGPKQMRALFEQYADLQSSERLNDLRLMADWLESYDSIARALWRGSSLHQTLNSIRSEKRAATSQEKEQIDSVLTAVRRDFSDLTDAAARRMANRGELGILATINAKAWANVLDVERQAKELAGVSTDKDDMDQGSLAVRSILPACTALAGQPFRISAVVHGASPSAKAEVLYRQPGQSFKTAALQFVSAGRLEGAIPAQKHGLIEYCIRVDDPRGDAVWPAGGASSPACLSVVPAVPSVSSPSKVMPEAASPAIGRAACSLGPLLVQVSWPDSPRSRVFRLMKSTDGGGWTQVATARDNWYEDRDVKVGSSYRYRVLDGDTGKLLAESGAVTVGRPELPAAPQPSIVAGPGRVRLSWSAYDINCADYRVYSSTSPDGKFAPVPDAHVLTDVRGLRMCVCPAKPGAQTYYRVCGISLDGREGAMSKPLSATAFEPNAKPVLNLRFDGTDAATRATEIREEGVQCVRTGTEPFVELANQDVFNTGGEIAVLFWVKLASPGVMPVLISHGMWDADGMFVQYYNSGIRFYLGGVGTLDAGGLKLGEWTAVAATYDGAEMTLYVNGSKVGSRPASGIINPCNRSLFVGRYETESKDFHVDGWMGGIRMYAYAVAPEVIEAHYQEMKSHTVSIDSPK